MLTIMNNIRRKDTTWDRDNTGYKQTLLDEKDLFLIAEIIVKEKNKKYRWLFSISHFIDFQDQLKQSLGSLPWWWTMRIVKRGLIHTSEEIFTMLWDASKIDDEGKMYEMYAELLWKYLDEYDNHISISVPEMVRIDHDY